MYRRHNIDERQLVVSRILSGEPIKALSRELGIHGVHTALLPVHRHHNSHSERVRFMALRGLFSALQHRRGVGIRIPGLPYRLAVLTLPPPIPLKATETSKILMAQLKGPYLQG